MTPRRSRTVQAVNNITSLQHRRPLPKSAGLAGGSFPGGSSSEQEGVADGVNTKAPPGPKILVPKRPLISRQVAASGRPAPQAAMARAPPQLRVTRRAPNEKNAGPNLRGRNSTAVKGPKKRDTRKGKSDKSTLMRRDGPISDDLSDSMVQQILRVQRKEWDRVPYEPKYAPGSFAANELIHTGRELFRGEAPPIKVWGRLEKTLGIVGMHGAAATLQVRRVPEQTWPHGWTRHDDRNAQLNETRIEASEKGTTGAITQAKTKKTAEA